MKHLKTFEQYENDNQVNEFFNPIMNDVRDKLIKLFKIDKAKAESFTKTVYSKLEELKKSGKIKAIVANGLNLQETGIKLEIDGLGDLYFNSESKGGAGFKPY